QILAEVFKNGWVFGRQRREIVDGFIDSGGQAGGGDIVTEDAAIHHLSEEGRLRDQLLYQMRDIFLAFGSEGFLIASATAESDDNDFAVALRDAGTRQEGAWKETAADGHAGGLTR